MCDYSLDFVASRPAKVGDKLVSTQFSGAITRGFAAVGEPGVVVCLLPGTELAFENEVEYDPALGSFLPNDSERSTTSSRTYITMRSNSPAGRSCYSRDCAKASARRCCSCPPPRVPLTKPRSKSTPG